MPCFIGAGPECGADGHTDRYLSIMADGIENWEAVGGKSVERTHRLEDGEVVSYVDGG